jgi:HK97 family phage major capsid protein
MDETLESTAEELEAAEATEATEVAEAEELEELETAEEPELEDQLERSQARLVGRGQLAGATDSWEGSRLTRTFSVSRAAIDEETRTVQVAFSSESPVERGWGVEVLDHQPSSIRRQRLEDGAPLLLEHDPDKHIGVIESVTIGEDRVARASVRFGNSTLAQEVFADVQDGVKRHISVGYVIHEVRQEGRDQESIYRAVDWEPLEISFVSIPADHSVGIGRSATHKKPEPKKGTITVKEEQNESVQDARAAELDRIKDIESLGAAHGHTSLARQFIAGGQPVDAFRAELLERIKSAPSPQTAEIGMSKGDKKRYSVSRLLRHLANPSDRRLREAAAFELECSEAAEEVQGRKAKGAIVPFDYLQRDIGVTTGAGVIETDNYQGDFIETLRANTVVFPHCTHLTGLQGDLDVPKFTTGTSAAFVANEAAAVAETSPVIGQVSLSPETLGTFVDIGRKLFYQSSPSVDQLIMRDIALAVGSKIDQTILNGSGSSGEPSGVINASGVNDIAHGTNGAAETSATMVTYLRDIQDANAFTGNMHWVLNPSTLAKWKTTQWDTSTGRYLAESLEADGIPILTTSHLPSNLTKGSSSGVCSAVVLGNFAQCIVAMWGGLDLMLDPYSLSSLGAYRLVGMQDLDIGFRHGQAFAKSEDVLTA